ncbi:hypothetical protein BH10ACI2_BH10ACI2_20090 [soil metagenome]
MKIVATAFLLVLFISVFSNAQCVSDPTPTETGPVLKLLKLKQKTAAEIGLSLTANVAGASWKVKGSEGAVITVFVDGKYSQDVMLFAGSRPFDYKVLLGRVEAGNHEFTIRLNKPRSSANAQNVTVSSARRFAIDSNGKNAVEDRIAIENSPFLYARPDAVDRFSDIPLITYYEIIKDGQGAFTVRYTTIFTNEDGGTQTAALLARWGRTTDIEWVYEMSYKNGKLVGETFQGANHVTTRFAGVRVFGGHPLIYTVTDNNNFADKGCSKLRIAPLPIYADLSAGSRETVMDTNPWTYRLMAEEAQREGRIDPQNMGVDRIDDLRNYVYATVFIDSGAKTVAVEIVTADGNTSRSDAGDYRLRISRPGYQRIAVHLPQTGQPIKSLKLLCHTSAGNREPVECGGSKVVGFTTLDKNYEIKNGNAALVAR